MTGLRQMRVRPHNDDATLVVVELCTYGGNADAPLTEPFHSEVCEIGDLPEAIMRAVDQL